jgi:hypothetical protein
MDALTSYFTDKKKEDEVQVIPNCWFMDGFVAVFFFPQFRTSILLCSKAHLSLKGLVSSMLCLQRMTESQENQLTLLFLGVGFCVSLKLESGYKSWPS